MSHIDLALVQPDWTRFMSPNGLAEKSGTGRDKFPRMILKELVDNAADAGGAWLSAFMPAANGTATSALGWGATRALQAEARLRAAGLVRYDDLGKAHPEAK